MKLAVEWRHLRASLLSAAALLLAGAAALGYAWHTRTAARAQLQQAQNALVAARQSLTRTEDEAQLLKQRITQFQALEARHLVGPERRVEWVELLRTVAAARHLDELQFELGPPRPIDAEWVNPDAGQLQVTVSSMRLDFPLDHEMLMFDLLQELAARAPALLRTKSCQLRRDADGLRGDCRVDWISWQERHG
ncbi:MAG: hypothetical protein KF778_19730 [Rhodocyclaceae bacterium]|nr:hypothetical protein [Rhodocyclaceae bacterium]MBX3670638.1 hypothetical protein [Rhodocyclaceae bacterium]